MSSKTGITTITLPKAQADLLTAILAGITPEAPAVEKAKGKGKSKKARKTANRKAAGTTIEGKTCLTAKNRKQFIADHGTGQGKSTRELVQAVAAGEITLVGNWAIGPRYAEKYGVTTTAAPVVEAPARPKAKVFRRANGTVAPKGEWSIREVLESQGLDRKQVDEKTAAALAVLGS